LTVGLLLALAPVLAPTARVSAAITERVVVDPRTGLAIHGFDPVAYFTDAAASVGREDLELAYAGAAWRFRNPGNRAAFAQRPDIYMPQFGGYDPIVLAHGVATPGHPQLWLVIGNRLYLFHSREARDAFAADSGGAIASAQARWPAVRHGLVP